MVVGVVVITVGTEPSLLDGTCVMEQRALLEHISRHLLEVLKFMGV